MTMFEVVCAVWVMAVLGGAAVGSWVTATHAEQLTYMQRSADDCADDAAELWLAGHAVSVASMDVKGCTVNVTEQAFSNGKVVTIAADVGNRTQTLSLSQESP